MLRVILLFVSVACLSEIYAHKFSMCGNNLPVTGGQIQVPDPLRIKKGTRLTFKFVLNVNEDLSDNLHVKLWLKKKVWFWIPMPCIKNIGSCNYKVTPKILKEIGLPPKLTKGSYPVEKSVYIGDNAFIPSFLVNGRYRAHGELHDGNRLVGCIEAEVTLE